MNYIVSDIAIRIKNAVLAKRKRVVLPKCNMSQKIANVLIKGHFLTKIGEELVEEKKQLVADISYYNRMPVITDIKIVSKPSLRVYTNVSDLVKEQGKQLGMIVVSTSQGVMSGKEAIEKGIGGEMLFEIW